MKADLIANMQNFSFEELFLRLSEEYENKGLRDILINTLFENKIDKIVFHLPQLAILTTLPHNPHISKLIDHFSSKNQCFFFLVIYSLFTHIFKYFFTKLIKRFSQNGFCRPFKTKTRPNPKRIQSKRREDSSGETVSRTTTSRLPWTRKERRLLGSNWTKEKECKPTTTCRRWKPARTTRAKRGTLNS